MVSTKYFTTTHGYFSTTINQYQSQTIPNNHSLSIKFSQQFQPINIVHGLWTRGVYLYIDIYIFIYSNSLSFHTYIIFLNQKSHQSLSNCTTLPCIKSSPISPFFFAFARILYICKNRIFTMLFTI